MSDEVGVVRDEKEYQCKVCDFMFKTIGKSCTGCGSGEIMIIDPLLGSLTEMTKENVERTIA